MPVRETPYNVTLGDKKIFELSKKNPSLFSSYYMKTDSTGTWWLPGAKAKHWRDGYGKLSRKWLLLGKPESFQYENKVYEAHLEHEKSEEYPDSPAFFQNHGFIMLPYHTELYLDKHPIRTIIGGFGSGKTMGMAANLLTKAVTIPEYSAVVLAPHSAQIDEIFRIMEGLMEGTLYQERFLWSIVKKPFPRIEVKTDWGGLSSIAFFSIANGTEKLRTLTLDEALVDQAEQVNDLEELIRSIGTRFRGRTKSGRGREGIITLLANADTNQELWDLFDMQDIDPDTYLSLSPSSFDNPYLTDADYSRFLKQVGNSKELQDQYLHGKRPLGNGEIFSRAVIQNVMDERLDALMNTNESGHIVLEQQRIGVHEWLLPYNPDKQYAVISDPGTKNPPNRDSGVIMVWDITGFPGNASEGTVSPAKLVGFVWVFGNGDINNWANRYSEMVYRYNAMTTNGFDATGFQSGYDEWLNALQGLFPEKLQLTGNNKYAMVNAARMLASNGLMKAPKGIGALYEQMVRYELPEPNHLRQDVVITFAMSAWWLQRLFYYMRGGERENNARAVTVATNRYYRPARSRHSYRHRR